MGKHKHYKFMGFLNISGEAEIHTILKTWQKKKTFHGNGFLKYFG